MSNAVGERSGKRRSSWALVVGAVLIGLLVWGLVREVLSGARVERLMQAAREAGEPVTLVELDAWYPIPPLGENAAPVYQRAFKAHVSPDEALSELLPIVGNANSPERGEPMSEEMLAACERYLEDNKAYLDLLHEAAAKPACRFPLNFRAGFNMVLSHLAEMRVAARHLELEAIVAAERGESEEAVGAVLAGLAVGDALRDQPILISQLVRIALNGITVAGLEHVFSRTALDDMDLQRLAEALAACEALETQEAALIGERCFGLDGFDQLTGSTALQFFGGSWIQSSQLAKLASGALAVFYKSTGLFERDRLAYWTMMTRMIEAGSVPPHERLAAAQRWEAEMEEVPKTRFLTRTIFSGVASFTRGFLRDLASMRTAAAGVAVERYRLKHGALPEGLEALARECIEALPRDPYNDASLLYKKLDRGYIVYSVGCNGIDDGGQEEFDREKGYFVDLAFCVER